MKSFVAKGDKNRATADGRSKVKRELFVFFFSWKNFVCYRNGIKKKMVTRRVR